MLKTFTDYLNHLPPKKLKNFHFIQIGGFDGIFDDPIHEHIVKHNWSGIIIEPQPEAFQILTKNYHPQKNILLLNLAITLKNKPVKLYRIKQNILQENWKNCFATLSSDRGDIGQTPATEIETITVPGKNINTVIQENNIHQLDLLQIDTEGYDYQIIKSFDFDFVKPNIIHYEHRHLKPIEIANCQKLLQDQQYQVIPLQFDTIAFQQN